MLTKTSVTNWARVSGLLNNMRRPETALGIIAASEMTRTLESLNRQPHSPKMTVSKMLVCVETTEENLKAVRDDNPFQEHLNRCESIMAEHDLGEFSWSKLKRRRVTRHDERPPTAHLAESVVEM